MALAFLVPAGVNLRDEFNIVNPDRDRSSDGWIGDAHHKLSISDHNPRDDGAVLALDIDVDGVPMARIVAWLVDECRAGRETRLQYVIYNRRIASRSWGWTWRAYHGANPHTRHAHWSFRSDVDGRRAGSWGIAERFGAKADGPHAVKPAPARPTSGPKVRHPAGSRRLAVRTPLLTGADVLYVQRWIGDRCGKPDAEFGPKTRAGVLWYQGMRRSVDPDLAVDGIVGPSTWRHLGVKWTGGKG